MKMKFTTGFVIFASLLMLSTTAFSQLREDGRRPSPMGITRATVADAYVKIHYSRPYVKDRDVFGAGEDFLVPFGKVWRTGANEDTEITLTEDIMIGGEKLAAGTYTLYTVPNADSWEVRFSPQHGLWAKGIYDQETPNFTPNVYDESKDVLRVSGSVSTLEESVEQLVIRLEEDAMYIRWATTEVTVTLAPAM